MGGHTELAEKNAARKIVETAKHLGQTTQGDDVYELTEADEAVIEADQIEAPAAREVIKAEENEVRKVEARRVFEAAREVAKSTGADAPLGTAFAVGEGEGEEGVIVAQHYVRPDGTQYTTENATY